MFLYTLYLVLCMGNQHCCYVLCGSGVLRILELPRNLRRPVANEKKLMATFLERENERVSDVGERKPAREAALKVAEEVKKKQAVSLIMH